MTTKFRVREGFVFKTADEKGNEKVYGEGEIVEVERWIGDTTHQLEPLEHEAPEGGKGKKD